MSNKEIDDIRSSEACPQNPDDKKCAPGVVFDAGSCIELNVLIEMAKAYNMDNSNKIQLHDTLETLNPRKYKKYLLREINGRTKQKCDSQKCWTEQKFIKNMNEIMRTQLEKFTFRPDGPDGRFEWLNTLNINDVMGQYENKYPEFKFLGAVPMDFDDLPSLGIKDLNFENLVKEGKTKLGIIFNLDEHWKSGSHWVGLYSDLKKGNTYYFDSYGVGPEPRVRKLMRRIFKFNQSGSGIDHPIADHNKIRHQYENSECGVYSINFILKMLRGDDFESVCKSKTPDKKINKCRNVYFKNSHI